MVGRRPFHHVAGGARDFALRLSEEQQSKVLDGVSYKADPLARSEANDPTAPRLIADWMLKFPQKTWQGGIRNVLRTWEAANPQELFAWMIDLPPQTRAEMVRQFPVYVSAEDAQKDFDSFMQAGGPVLRAQLLEKLMREAKDARTAMLEVLGKPQLSAAQKAHLASLIPIPVETAASED